MHLVSRIVLAAIVLALGACSSRTEENAPGPGTRPQALASGIRQVTILHVNDTHSHLEADGPKDRHLDGTLGGLVKAATVITREKARDPATLLVHAGDLFQEDVYFGTTAGVAELQLLSSLGLDAMTLGNHELNLTPQALLVALASSFAPADALPGGAAPPSPVVTANLDFANASLDGLQAYVQANVVREVGGVRVGFFGLVVPDPAEQFPTARPDDPAAIDSSFVEIAARQVAALRGPPASADVVVLLSHLGFDRDEEIARAVGGLDAIVGGHDHALGKRIVGGPGGKLVPVVHAGEFYEWVGKLTLTIENGSVTAVDEEFIPVDARVERFAPFAEIVEGLQAQADLVYGEELFHTPIAFALFDTPKDPRPDAPQRDSPVGNLIADALRHAGGTEIGFTANGILTEGLWHGFLVRADAFRIVGDGFDPDHPFGLAPGARLGAPLVRLALRGDVLEAALAGSLALGGDWFPQVSGMSVAFDSTNPAWLRIRVGGAPVDPERTYTVTADFALVQGLSSLLPEGAFQLLPPPECTEYEAVRDWLARLRIVAYGSQGRILDLARR